MSAQTKRPAYRDTDRGVIWRPVSHQTHVLLLMVTIPLLACALMCDIFDSHESVDQSGCLMCRFLAVRFTVRPAIQIVSLNHDSGSATTIPAGLMSRCQASTF